LSPSQPKKKPASHLRGALPLLKELVRPRRGKIALGFLLMLIGRELEKDKGVTKAGLMTATKENMEVMRDAGFSPPTGLSPSSILIAVEADTEPNAKATIQHSKILMDKEVTDEAPSETLPRMEDISKLVSKDQFKPLAKAVTDQVPAKLPAKYNFNFMSAAGTAILIAAFLSALSQAADSAFSCLPVSASALLSGLESQ